ncbi:EAL domain-containing protein [Crocosphaera sp. XPORK-15E]|uniref:EAL domain-containing protein n=1 Tax=Crocosphaera sp. XPORK-15E TaxID=3110247 RepID=UPI002B21815D|nr:EAL domain-containing protein [Crocosphaera sp. XPORK-15E]MEA5536235.1 EAL domain-containing protein [Crocosphaera sp. XPORK-15E]
MIGKLHQVIRSFFLVAQANKQPHQGIDGLSNPKMNQLKPKPKKVRIFSISSILLSSVLVTLPLIGLRQIGRLQFLELVAYDQMVRVLPSGANDSRLLIVGVTEADIQKQKQWPLSDQVIAQLLNKLQADNPKVIGLDIYRDLPHPPGSELLNKALQADNIVVVKQLPTSDSEQVPPPPEIPPHRVGFSDLPIDPDNVVRRTFMYIQSKSGKIKESSFALQIALNYLAQKNQGLQVKPESLQIGPASFLRLQSNAGGYQLPPSEAVGWQILLKYRGKNVAREVSLEDALQGKIDPNWVKDKIVLIGVTAPSNKDTFPTPYSATATKNFEMPGVVLHGQIVSQILGTVLDEEQPFWFWHQGLEWAWIWLWSLLGGIVVWRSQRLWILGGNVLISLGGLWMLCLVIFSQSGWIPVIPPLLGFLLTGACVLAYKTVYQTYHDPLTGLANRRSLESKLKKLNTGKAFLKGELVAVLFIDVNRFKTINDGLGHQAGDYLLMEIAQRLQQHLPSSENLGRVGGDEFAIWLQGVNDPQGVKTFAETLQQDLSQPFYWQGQEIFTTISIGIAFDRTGQGFQAGQLLRYADIAMYRAKEIGSGRPQVFETGMDTQAVQRWQLETDLRLGLERREFQLYYQPIISLKTRKIAGFEALVRWNSPQRGFVSPGDFIPVAEETGLIIPLGEWILTEACRQMRCWHEQFPQTPALMMSVNLSGRQFTQPDLVKQIQHILDEAKIDSDRLKLEITESMMMNDVEAAIELLNRLKGLGLRLSIDDFGTGYSSLSYLHRFPLDTLKVDKSFVGRMEEGEDSSKYITIVRTIISLGHNLHLDVIAEGIETSAQLEILESLQCEYGQGYFFYKPLSHENAEALLAREYGD